MDIRNREQRNVDMGFYETNRELESELYQAYQWADQIQREKIYSFGDLEMRNTFFQRSRVRNLKEIEELRRICCEETDRAKQFENWRIVRPCNRSGIFPLWVSSWLKFRICMTRRTPWLMQDIFTILRQRAALEHPTFPANPEILRVLQRYAQQRFWIASRLLEKDHGYFRKRLFENLFAREFSVRQLLRIDIHRNMHRLLADMDRRGETRSAEFFNTNRTSKSRRWNFELFVSHWRILFSEWCDGFRDIPDLGIASWKVVWLIGISKLESQFQNWSMYKLSFFFFKSLCIGSKKLKLQNQ